MKTNKYAGACGACGNHVARRAGVLRGARGTWRVYHLACDPHGGETSPGVVTFRTSGGTFIQNSRGRCEDAPCCGCCTC